MPDTILELMTRVDVGPLKSAMTDAAGAVASSTAQMKGSFGSLAAGTSEAIKGTAAAIEQVNPSLTKMSAGGIFAFEEIKRSVIETTAEVGRLRQEILETNDAAKLEKLNAQLDQARARMTAARTEMRAMRLETAETREKADLLGDSMGIKIPGALGKLVGQIPAVQGLMNALFAPSLVLFFADAVLKAADGIAEMASKMGGFGEAEKKAYESALEYNQKRILQQLELRDQIAAVSVIGKEGAAKYVLETKNAEEAARRWNAELANTQRQLNAAQTELERLQRDPSVLLELKYSGDLSGHNLAMDVEKAQGTVDRLMRLRNELQAKNDEKPVKTDERTAEEAARQGEEARAVQRANTDAQKALQNEYISFYEQGLRRMYAAEKITLEDEVEGERAAIQARLQNERDGAAKRKAELTDEHQATGKDVSPQITAVNEKLVAEELKASSALADLLARFDTERLAHQNAVNLATVQAAKKTGDAEIQVIEETAKRRFESGEIMLAELTAIEKAASNQRIDGRRSELQELLRQANEYPEKYKDKIITLNGQLLDLERERTVQSDAIDAEAANRKREVLAIEAEAAKAHQQTLLEIERLGINTRASLGLISGQQRLTQLRAITEQEYQLEREAIEKKRALYAQGTAQYEQAERELQAINDRYNKQMAEDDATALKMRLEKWKQFDQQITMGFSRAVGEMLQGQKTFGQAMAELWRNMVVDFAQMLTQMIIEATIKAAIMKVIMAVFGKSPSPQQQAAADTAAAETKVQANTGQAASDVFLQAIESVPFPANLAAAPAAAAGVEAMMAPFAAQAAGGGVASAAGGMDVTHDQLAMVHKDEKVLPAGFSRDLSAAVGGAAFSGIGFPRISGGLSDLQSQMAALHSGASGSSAGAGSSSANRGSGGGGDTFKTLHNHVRIEVHNHNKDAQMSQEEISNAVKRGVRSGAVSFKDFV